MTDTPNTDFQMVVQDNGLSIYEWDNLNGDSQPTLVDEWSYTYEELFYKLTCVPLDRELEVVNE
jgi:hypothetical protein